jgi:hypothetical protein
MSEGAKGVASATGAGWQIGSQVPNSRMQARDESTAALAWTERLWKVARREEGLVGCAAMVTAAWAAVVQVS